MAVGWLNPKGLKPMGNKTVISVAKLGPAFHAGKFTGHLGSRWVLELAAIVCGMRKELVEGAVKVTQLWRWDRSAG